MEINQDLKEYMLIFDEAGCHRGSRLTLSDRYILRFLFKRA